MARGGAFQRTFGAGAAPATPSTRGGFPQAKATKVASIDSGWTSLFVCGIITNTFLPALMLVWNEGFV
jgi:hypothetical protein